jgi:predicted ribosome quality control (RQC) complex YloA/Tae2 family protein
VDKAYHIGGFNVLLRLKGREGKGAILVSSGSYAVAGDMDVPEGTQPSGFAMLLRKHLSGARLTGVGQEGFDRILRFSFDGPDGQRELVVELFASGNIILLQDGVIVQPLTVRSWSKRILKSHEAYLPPPAPVDVAGLTSDALYDIFQSSKSDAVRTLAASVGLGGQFAEEVCAQAGVEKAESAKALTHEQTGALLKEISRILALAESGTLEPLVIMEDGSPVDFSPFRLRIHDGRETRPCASFGEAIMLFYEMHPREVDGVEESVAEGRRATIELAMEQQRKAIERLELETAESERKAEEIYVNYQYYDKIINIVRKLSIEEVPAAIKGARIVDPRKHLYSVPSPESGDMVLQMGKDINQNAGILYDAAKKVKERLEGARKALEETAAKGKYLDGPRHEPKQAKRKQAWFESYRWFVTSEGNLAIAGKDARTNEQAVKKHLKDKDVYAHAEVHGAPSVVLKASALDGTPLGIGDASKREACEFSLAFSKLWNAGLTTGASYWVTPDQVSKTPEPGEYLGKGAFVIRGKRNYAQEIRVRCALGPFERAGALIAMCGPESALEANCERYVVLEPGDLKKTDVAKDWASALGLPLDEVMQVMPPGNCRVVSAKGVDMKY